MEIICADYSQRADLKNIYAEYHYIARYYNWSRKEIKLLPSKERVLWVDKIIEHENMLNGGDEANNDPSGE